MTLAGLTAVVDGFKAELGSVVAKFDQTKMAQDAEIAAQKQRIAALEGELITMKETLQQLAAVIGAGAGVGTGAPAAGQQHFRPDELRLKVKPEEVASVSAIIRDTMLAERPGSNVQFSVRPILPKRGQPAAAQAGQNARALLAMRVHPADRRWFLTLGGALRRKGVQVDDSLTPSGVLLRKTRGRVFGALLAEAKKSQDAGRPVKRVRWEQGVEISYLNASNQRVRYDFDKPANAQGLPEAVAKAVQAALDAAPAAPAAAPTAAPAATPAAAPADVNMTAA